ncbi:MAG: hypothetical protein JWM19_7197 [Actinomycetia bacterium]|nr:hypothetical protein [Actinomycetes bacterium]
MADYVTKGMQDDFLNAIRTSQGMTIQAVRTCVALVQPVASKSFFVPLQLGELPKPEEINAGIYDFAEKLLDNQRHFTQEMLEAAAPLMRDSSEQ